MTYHKRPTRADDGERTLTHADRWLADYQRHDAQADADLCDCETDEPVPASAPYVICGVFVCLLLFGGTVYFLGHIFSWINP